jgi:HD-GYP domain-containing protein (c-di-GMP phosphodiesterase class II)
MRVLLLQSQDDVREMLTFSVESTFSASVDGASSFQQAIKVIQGDGTKYDLLVCDCPSGVTPEFQSFQSLITKVPTILCLPAGAVKQVSVAGNIVAAIDRDAIITNLMGAIDELIKKQVVNGETEEVRYCRIRTSLLLSVCPLKGDIYIRLSDQKFVRLFKTGDTFERADLQKYTEQKKISHLYVRKEECEEFIQKYKEALEKMVGGPPLDLAALSKSSDTAIETVQDLSQRIGFTKEVQALAKTQVALAVKAMGRNPRLSDIMAKLKDNPGKYIASHSNLCAYLSCAIASQMEWGSETTFFKLNLAAFLHDITLTNHEIAAYRSLKELELDQDQFKPADVQAFKLHTVRGAEIARQFNEIPADVDTIVMQHHEAPDGSGFPRGLSHSYIAPLTQVFIVAHELAQETLRLGKDFSMSKFVERAKEKYRAGGFKKVMAAIEVFEA